jgi:hypothetical protein
MMREMEVTENPLDLRVDVGDDITIQEEVESTPYQI